MSAGDFRGWYTRLHKRDPFPWQERLARNVTKAGRFPDAIALPTGAGKTTIIAIWAWARTVGIRLPTRLAYVIDRRLVVDSITDYAVELAKTMPESHRPYVVRLRGGLTPDDAWFRDPLRPTILVSTVDQVGSRLLFRGYGVSSLAAPIHAGLLGEDTLIIVDEAHLSVPFVTTLRTIQKQPRKVGLPWQVVNMTATPASDEVPFLLDEADRRHPVLSMRMSASKPAMLVASKADGFIDAVADAAKELRASKADVVGVVVNRVADARGVFEVLGREGEAVLLTGRIRPWDRERLLEALMPRVIVGSRAAGRAPLYVVSTQTIEVGADLDFDGMVTESAPISALRQRFGRLNRLGEIKKSGAVIVHRSRSAGEGADPVYGDDLAAAWKWLNAIAKRKVVDFGIEAFSKHVGKVPAETVDNFPILTLGAMEALSFTSPKVDIDVAPFLHGWRTSADVQIAWRADLGETTEWGKCVEAVPPVLDELLTLPIYEARRWLDADAGRGVALRWNGDQSDLIDARQLRSGDVIIVPCAYGGCDHFGWDPTAHRPVQDCADIRSDDRTRVRISPALYPERADEIRAALGADPMNVGALLEIADVPNETRCSGVVRQYPGGLLFEKGIWQVERPQSLAVPLDEHLKGVGDWGARFAALLHSDMGDAVTIACRLHDVGKADPRFQLMLGARRGELLAKSGLGPDEAAEMRRMAQLPRGWRHEVESVRRRMNEPPLIRYLIGTHHGYGRPELPAAPDAVQWKEASGDGWADMVADLSTEYGFWGLAYLSALVRMADWSRSAEELELGPQRRGGKV